jgi:hypothetical protein
VHRRFSKRFAVAVLCGLVPLIIGRLSPAVAQESSTYRTPYRVQFTVKPDQLIGDLIQTERGDPRNEAEIPHGLWYSRRALERWHSWGPAARFYPAPPGVFEWPLERQRERVVAVALRFLGYGYQHHHIPDWDPPPSWPWKNTCVGSNGKGVDCSNFTAFVYNLGFGLKLSGDVHRQSEQRFVEGPGPDRRTPIRHIPLSSSYAERIRTLRTGDLVFIRSRQERISHVVLWIGPIGRAPDNVPLIMDSHGDGVRDSNDQTIPCGIQLRPFRENSWYNHSADHALRLLNGPEE